MKKKYKFVTGIHGDEIIPIVALASLGIKQIVANPKAICTGKRFVDCDLNSSFEKKGNRYEEVLARKILRKIRKDNLVIDLHTFSAKSEPFVVIVDLKLKDFAASLGFKHVVYMKHNIKKGSALINYRQGVSVEIGNHDDLLSFNRVIKLVERLNKPRKKTKEVKFYEVYDIIKKPGKYENFKMHKSGFIPVLAGEKAYSFYGLKAKVI